MKNLEMIHQQALNPVPPDFNQLYQIASALFLIILLAPEKQTSNSLKDRNQTNTCMFILKVSCKWCDNYFRYLGLFLYFLLSELPYINFELSYMTNYGE